MAKKMEPLGILQTIFAYLLEAEPKTLMCWTWMIKVLGLDCIDDQPAITCSQSTEKHQNNLWNLMKGNLMKINHKDTKMTQMTSL